MDHVSKILYRAWTGAAERADVHRALDGLPVPGRVELRSRYLHLRDASAVPPAALGEPLDEVRWEEIIRLEHEGDVALGRSPNEAAGPFRDLAGLEYSARLRVVTVHALFGLGDAARQLDDDRCLDLFGEAIAIARADGYRPGLVRALVSCGYALMVKAALVEAGAHFEEAARLAAELDDRTYRANALLGLGETRMRQRDLPAARRHMWAARRAFARLGSPIGLGNVHERLASVFKSEGRLRDAADMLREAEVGFEAAGTVIGRVNVLEQLGDVAAARARYGEAEEAYRRAEREAARHGYRRGRLNALEGLARTAREQGAWTEAEALYREALDGYRGMEDVVGTVRAFDGLALSRGANAGPAAELAERVRSVQELERLRAGGDRHDVQVEYRSRFTGMYGAALRCAVDLADLDAAVYLLECLAGRRLAGMVEEDARAPDDGLAAHMLARADQRLLGSLPQADGTSRRERVKRLLDATALREGLTDQAAAAADDAAAALYLPADPAEASDLLGAVPPGCHVLFCGYGLTGTPEPELAWLWRDPSGATSCGRAPATAHLRSLIDRAAAPTVAERLGPSVRGPSWRDVLPPGLAEALDVTEPADLVVLPIGALWRLPWPAVRLPSGRVLAGHARLRLCPSLTVHRALVRRTAGGAVATGERMSWRNPDLSAHQLAAAAAWRSASGPSDVRTALLEGGPDLLAVVAHGRHDGGAVYLELAPGEVLPLADMLAARPPRRLALVCCWGGAPPGDIPADPVSFGLVALLRGSHEVLSCLDELADTAEATMLVNRILHRLDRLPLPEAVRDASENLFKHPALRAQALYHWAPLVCLGAYTEGDAR
ncbi:CHAT domain-containing protein [Actinomadura chokoriensis]|uniref:CHAT domain-containing protein n=1 Tax=Actinomadura chokoriensis TaxID=454156 RepID=UPI0031F79314